MSVAPLDVKSGSLGSTSMRYHELALQAWLYRKFFVREGYPVPVVFSMPMDAFSTFSLLWKDPNNPFAYLLRLKDEKGTPLYEPYPSPVRYPLLSVSRKMAKLRTYQNFSQHRFRHINWPTVSDTGTLPVNGKNQTGYGLLKCDLGNVTTSRMPMAFDYRFQIDHWCRRPDTQAFFLERLLQQFWRTGGSLQTWITVDYPGWGQQYVRLYVEGDTIDHHAPEEQDATDKQIEYRTSFTIILEGFSVDVDYQVLPTLWTIKSSSATPVELNGLFYPPINIDLREVGENPTLEARTDIPASGTCARDHLELGQLDTQTIYLGDPNLNSTPADNDTYVATYSYGIPSESAVGTPTVTTT